MKLPIICFHFGGPPLPDVSNTAIEDLVLNDLPSGSVGDIQNLQNEERCYPLQEMMTFKLSSLQITPGVYYIGLFNGFGPIRTQSKMAIPYQKQDIPIVYLPDRGNVSSESVDFYLEPYLSKSSYGNGHGSDYGWTYFLLHTEEGTEGYNSHIQLTSDTKLSYGLYVRFGGLPSLDMWDYSYLDQTSKSNNNNSMFKSYDTSQEGINLYILYPTAGLWIIGLRHPVDLNNQSSPRTMMTISTVYCPNQCSGHGICEYNDDLSEFTGYSFSLFF
ncbi:hypothetical protein CFP56_022376 [Quercus suber]|uniref:Uncharacterized protein n=1 Tax=Quercus suber TaxID=58331 RepID=A0AAW0KDE0_QUESU